MHICENTYPQIRLFRQGDWYQIAAGWLIEQAGWKGYRTNDFGCYDRQDLILVNYGQATGEEIYSLSERIRESVAGKYGILLEWEVNIVS